MGSHSSSLPAFRFGRHPVFLLLIALLILIVSFGVYSKSSAGSPDNTAAGWKKQNEY